MERVKRRRGNGDEERDVDVAVEEGMGDSLMKQATTTVAEAIELDNENKYEEAYAKYRQALEQFLTAMRYVNNPETRQVLAERLNGYMDRAEQLKKAIEFTKEQKEKKKKKKVLVLEPFHHGSHAYLCRVLELLQEQLEVKVVGLGGKSKWHWRMLVSSAQFYSLLQEIDLDEYDIVLASAMFNLAELIGMVPQLAAKRKLVYFHENQLEYPKSSQESAESKGQSDFNLVWNQIASCLCADHVFFNSSYNLESFLVKVGPFINKVPKPMRPDRVTADFLRHKSSVLYLPITVPLFRELSSQSRDPRKQPLHVVWAHRWEHDKGPETLLRVLKMFNSVSPGSETEGNQPFMSLSVLGEVYDSTREEFEQAKTQVPEGINILHWGRLESREAYVSVLQQADVVLSTSVHEFFGVSILEGATCGCYPICPNRLSYPELFPRECLYNTDKQLFKLLRSFCKNPTLPRKKMAAPEWRERLLRFQFYEPSESSTLTAQLGPSAREWMSKLKES